MGTNELVELLQKNGLRRIDATILALFRDGRQRVSAEIENETGLRQPAILTSMMRMLNRGWFLAEFVKSSEGYSRTTVRYRLAMEYKEICGDIAEEQGTKIAGMMADLNSLRTVA